MSEQVTRRNPIRGGRLYTQEIHAKVVDAVRRGRPIGLAGELAGLGKDTIWDWIAYARHQPSEFPEYVQLLSDIEQAKADYADEALAKIQEAADSDPRLWTARAWILERTRPDEFGKRDRVEIETSAPLVQVNNVMLSDPVARQHARALLQSFSQQKELDVIDGDAVEVEDQ